MQHSMSIEDYNLLAVPYLGIDRQDLATSQWLARSRCQ